ncbi:hypothetical protein NQ317_017994 [Molorchus minor]|uniref:Uncharacterized protein n=1 Tax=Molorchus minor TaxID=1323400 RepID=A0ABQ9J8P5_9CUCU|nr:hypothetical protein NQ317_017994 [Molorchus minor]
MAKMYNCTKNNNLDLLETHPGKLYYVKQTIYTSILRNTCAYWKKPLADKHFVHLCLAFIETNFNELLIQR